MYFKVKNEAIAILKNCLDKLGYEIPDEIKLDNPTNPELGDFASTISFELAKVQKRSPMEIASEIMGNIEIKSIFQKIEAKGPYINFFIDYSIFAKELLKTITKDYGQLEKTGKKIILEHTSANPNGPLHIGHIRNAIIGDSLKRLLTIAGNNLDTQYYVNDMGRQIAIIVFGIKDLKLELDPNFSEKIDHQIGNLYFKANQKLNEEPELNTKVGDLIKTYEAGKDSKLNIVFEKAVEDCLTGVKETLHKLNIEHDEFVWEGQFVRNGEVNKIVDDLIATGYTKKGEVLILDLSQDFGIEKELVLRRSDGTSLYSTRDLAYHSFKSKQGDVVLDILGADHKLAIDQVSVALELIGEKAPEVVFYEFINLPEGSMSTRRGVFVSVDDLIVEAITRAEKELKTRRPELTNNELLKIAEEIGIGAIRYYIAKLSPEKHITFKWDEALSFEKGCASIQYAHARACKLLEKSKKANDNLEIAIDNIDDEEWDLNKAETDLIRILAKFPQVISESAKIRRIHLIAQYVQDLSSAFNKFYKSEQVINHEYEYYRLLLVDKTRITIKNALDILGVVAPITM
ncbi:arginine--tRNA ligase [Methanobrevibacter filiformis]|uniref:Arginine--tRNA ligase n=1 Tax=Methanobrevibacter filiformis TaxID=55758 RepID=A0A165ZNY4_9EURY|nr:arginine--tRNA ligase [Methanobrevibacter filiformis]KZX10968.1 arginine--tRNA ligase [Methanobrevibacter filiformis]